MVKVRSKPNTPRMVCALLAALTLLLLSVPAAAEYAPSGNEPVPVSDGVTYDPLQRSFVFEANGGKSVVRSTALDGMVVSSPVSVSGGGVFLYKNGAEYDGSLDPVTEPGEYVVMVNSAERSVRVLAFTIVGKTTGLISVYRLPEGMIVDSVTFNGEEVTADYRSVSMEREGDYKIVSECVASGAVYTLETTVDRTPPALAFEGAEDNRGRFNSAVTVTGLGGGEKISVTRDGQPYSVRLESDGTVKLTESGMYGITAFDEAGNSSEYSVLIMAYLNASGTAFVVLVVLVAAAVIVYVIVRRRKMRIG